MFGRTLPCTFVQRAFSPLASWPPGRWHGLWGLFSFLIAASCFVHWFASAERRGHDAREMLRLDAGGPACGAERSAAGRCAARALALREAGTRGRGMDAAPAERRTAAGSEATEAPAAGCRPEGASKHGRARWPPAGCRGRLAALEPGAGVGAAGMRAWMPGRSELADRRQRGCGAEPPHDTACERGHTAAGLTRSRRSRGASPPHFLPEEKPCVPTHSERRRRLPGACIATDRLPLRVI